MAADEVVFELRASEDSKGFGGSLALPEGKTLDIGARLKKGNGKITSKNEIEIDALDRIEALKRVEKPARKKSSGKKKSGSAKASAKSSGTPDAGSSGTTGASGEGDDVANVTNSDEGGTA